MLDAGCRGVVMSGSGSTLVGIADSAREARACASELSTRCLVASTRVAPGCGTTPAVS
jgi:4-diphosphocytidyl-2C-methyl-D-erythritol kinase